MALSHSFEVKSRPLYHLISGRVHRALGNMNEAHISLETALQLYRKPQRKAVTARRGSEGLSQSEVVTIYLEIVAVLTTLGKQVYTV